MLNSQTYYHFKLDFQKLDLHTGGKWLIHGTKRLRPGHTAIYGLITAKTRQKVKQTMLFAFMSSLRRPTVDL